MGLDNRSKDVLRQVVLSYIDTALPVGSRAITEGYDFGVGAGTIRNIMADLEDEGFLTHPHTSAGRVPTEKGYRFYVDALFQEETFLAHETQIRQRSENLVHREDTKTLLQDTSKLLSELSNYMAVVSAPKVSAARIQHIEFVRLRSNCVMAISVSEAGFVQNKFFELSKDLSQGMLNDISDYLNSLYKGRTLLDMRNELVREMAKMEDLYDDLHAKVFEVTNSAVQQWGANDDGDIYVDGAVRMLGLPDFSDQKLMTGLLEALEGKKHVLHLLDGFIRSDEVQVFIGAENQFLGDHGCSLVVSHYKRGDRVLGALGVIGPTRMDYSKVIPLVDSAAKQLSRILNNLS